MSLLKEAEKEARKRTQQEIERRQLQYGDNFDINYIRAEIAASLISEIRVLRVLGGQEYTLNIYLYMIKILLSDLLDSLDPRGNNP